MRKYAIGAIVVALACPAAALAQSALDGTWKTDPSTMSWSGKPTIYMLHNGVFACESCVPPQKVKVDGQPHVYTGNPYIDSMAVTVVDDHTVRAVGMKGGHERGVQTFKVAPDGKSMTMSFAGQPMNPGAAGVTYTRTYSRVTAAPAGANAISGAWQRTAETAMSESAKVNVFKVDGGTVHWSAPNGVSYAAGLDGKPAPIKGDPGASSVTLQKISAHEIVETDWSDGKKVDVTTYRVSPDGKTLTIVDHDPKTGLVTTSKAIKE